MSISAPDVKELRTLADDTDVYVFEIDGLIILQKAGTVGEGTCCSFEDTPTDRTKALEWIKSWIFEDE